MIDPQKLAALLMRQIPPGDAEVVERGNFVPLGTYRTPDGKEMTTLAFPQPMREGLDAMAYALGYKQDPAAPAGYVTHDALNRGGMGLAESAIVGSAAARAPRNALRSGVAQGKDVVLKSGNEAVRYGDELTVQNDAGFVDGRVGRDPQIAESHIYPEYRGQGVGSQLYRDWAEEAGGPFRSDVNLSDDSVRMYEHMFPKYGYNVLKNPTAWRTPFDKTMTKDNRHVYRVEPPGMPPSTEFYTNPLAGAVPLMWQDHEQQERDKMARFLAS